MEWMGRGHEEGTWGGNGLAGEMGGGVDRWEGDMKMSEGGDMGG